MKLPQITLMVIVRTSFLRWLDAMANLCGRFGRGFRLIAGATPIKIFPLPIPQNTLPPAVMIQYTTTLFLASVFPLLTSMK